MQGSECEIYYVTTVAYFILTFVQHARYFIITVIIYFSYCYWCSLKILMNFVIWGYTPVYEMECINELMTIIANNKV
jgi:hypothetical protein